MEKNEFFTESTFHLYHAAIPKQFELEGCAWSRMEDNLMQIKKLSQLFKIYQELIAQSDTK